MITVGVTGSSGIMGKKVVEVLKGRGYKVKEMDHREIDIFKPMLVSKWVDGVDGIIHLAAIKDLARSDKEFYETNVVGTKNIIEAASTKNLKVVSVSTVMVFKENSVISDESFVKKETSDNKYVKSKLEALKISQKYKNGVIIYPSIVIDKSKSEGSTGGGWFTNIIWKYIGGGIPGGVMAMIGNKNRCMNIVELNDVAEGTVLALEKGKIGEDYIVGGINITAGEYLERMRKLTGAIGVDIRIPAEIVKQFGIDEPENMYFSSEKARINLGYSPKWKLG